MKKYQFHKRWGEKYLIQPNAVDYAYSLIEEPVKQMEYLEYLTKVTEWWDDNDIEYIPIEIKRNCKTAADRIKTEREYKDYLSEYLRGVPMIPKKRKFGDIRKGAIFLPLFFKGRTTGRDLSRVKDIGYFQSYMQQKYIRPKGRPCFLAWYLHHLIDYSHANYETMSLTEIINRNRDRIRPLYPAEFDEIANFIQQYWEDLKHDFKSH